MANQRLEELASIDPLTGASNRRYFLEQARIETSRAKRQGHALSVIMLDIDFFKSINDRFGHEIGDKGWWRLPPPYALSCVPAIFLPAWGARNSF